VDINNISKGLKNVDGVWVSDKVSGVSYSQDGHEHCYSIEDNSFWFNHRNDCVVAAILNFLPPRKDLLDVGGGNGFVSKAIQDAGVDVALLEPGLDGVKNAKRRGVSSVIHAALGDVDIIDGSVSSAGLFDVLEHIEDDVKFLECIRKVISSDGFLYITAPAYKILWSVYDENSGHYRRYTASLLRKRLEMAGFQVEYSTYFFSLMPIPTLFLRTLPSFLGIRKKVTFEQKEKEHQPKRGLLNKLMALLFSLEKRFIKRRVSMPFGSSCLVVAKPKQNR